MKMIDAYYRFEKLNSTKSKTRFDLVFNSEIYEHLHKTNKAGDCWIYFGKNPYIKTSKKRETDLSISNREGHLTSVFIPEIENSKLAFGDLKEDLLLFVIESSIEIMILKGKKHLQTTLFNLLYDGEFDTEIETFRKQFRDKK